MKKYKVLHEITCCEDCPNNKMDIPSEFECCGLGDEYTQFRLYKENHKQLTESCPLAGKVLMP